MWLIDPWPPYWFLLTPQLHLPGPLTPSFWPLDSIFLTPWLNLPYPCSILKALWLNFSHLFTPSSWPMNPSSWPRPMTLTLTIRPIPIYHCIVRGSISPAKCQIYAECEVYTAANTASHTLNTVPHTANCTCYTVLHTPNYTLTTVLHIENFTLNTVLHTANYTLHTVLHTAH